MHEHLCVHIATHIYTHAWRDFLSHTHTIYKYTWRRMFLRMFTSLQHPLKKLTHYINSSPNCSFKSHHFCGLGMQPRALLMLGEYYVSRFIPSLSHHGYSMSQRLILGSLKKKKKKSLHPKQFVVRWKGEHTVSEQLQRVSVITKHADVPYSFLLSWHSRIAVCLPRAGDQGPCTGFRAHKQD